VKSSLWAAPRSLVYCDKISCHLVQGFSSNEGVEARRYSWFSHWSFPVLPVVTDDMVPYTLERTVPSHRTGG